MIKTALSFVVFWVLGTGSLAQASPVKFEIWTPVQSISQQVAEKQAQALANRRCSWWGAKRVSEFKVEVGTEEYADCPSYDPEDLMTSASCRISRVSVISVGAFFVCR